MVNAAENYQSYYDEAHGTLAIHIGDIMQDSTDAELHSYLKSDLKDERHYASFELSVRDLERSNFQKMVGA